jgi:hypothetical protein
MENQEQLVEKYEALLDKASLYELIKKVEEWKDEVHFQSRKQLEFMKLLFIEQGADRKKIDVFEQRAEEAARKGQ